MDGLTTSTSMQKDWYDESKLNDIYFHIRVDCSYIKLLQIRPPLSRACEGKISRRVSTITNTLDVYCSFWTKIENILT